MPDARAKRPFPRNLDEIAVGQTFVTGSSVLTAEDELDFARRFDPQPFHVDADAAMNSFFGGLAASGWQTAAVSMRLLVDAGFVFDKGLIGAHADLTWPSPTRVDDVLHVEVTILDARPSKSRPGRGIATVRYETMTEARETRLVIVADWLVFAAA
ncbi:MAG: dehydratase [Microbacteriaceae bacterium]|nr:dehydratase [Microbacteriaceae bacterium]